MDSSKKNYKKLFALAVLILAFVLIGISSAFQAAAEPNAVTKSSASLRAGAGSYHEVIKTLSSGTKVTIVGKEMSWYKVVVNGTTGYITEPLINVTDPMITWQYKTVKKNYEKLASYTSYYSRADADRNYNIELGGFKNSKIIKSGASFSFNRNTGNSNLESNGWREAHVIINQEYAMGIGGGLCQVSSTIYSAVKQLNKIKILERHPHSRPVGYVPVSGEAMINYGSSDQRWRNDYSYDIFLNVTVNLVEGSITATVYKIGPPVDDPAPTTVPKATPKPTPTPTPTPAPVFVKVDGEPLTFDVPPTMIDDRVYIGIRALFEKLGYTVEYNDETKAITMVRIDEKSIVEPEVEPTVIPSVDPNNENAAVDANGVTIDVAVTEGVVTEGVVTEGAVTENAQPVLPDGTVFHDADILRLEKGAESEYVIRERGGVSTFIAIPYKIHNVEGRTMFSVRFAAELAGLDIDWDDATRTVLLTTPAPIVATPEPTEMPPAETALAETPPAVEPPQPIVDIPQEGSLPASDETQSDIYTDAPSPIPTPSVSTS